MVVLLIHVCSHPKRSQRVRRRQQVELRRRDRPVYHDLPEVPDIQIERVEQEGALRRVAVAVYRVENGGQPHDQLGQDPPQILHIPEEHKQRRQDQSHPQIEHDHASYRVQQQEKPPCKRDPVHRHKGEENQQRQPEIDEGRHILRKQEQILRHIHLGKNSRVAHQRVHPQISRVRKVGKHQLSRKQIDRVVVHIIAEKVAEHQPHNQQVHQRGQDAPGHAQNRPLVLLGEVPLHQLAEQKLVLSQFLYNLHYVTPGSATPAAYPRGSPPMVFAAPSPCPPSAFHGRSRSPAYRWAASAPDPAPQE